MSCIYGPRQHGTEDQGWVAHFIRNAIRNNPLTIYGAGYQVRDLLYADDLIDAMLLARAHAAELSGKAFNIGGGLHNAVSVLELLELIRMHHGSLPSTGFGDWRSSDQKYYVSNISSFTKATHWRPRVGVQAGLKRLYDWLLQDSCKNAEPDSAFASAVDSDVH
jgi:CDP-paratose 2-epimerase